MVQTQSVKTSSIRLRYSLRLLGAISLGFAMAFAWFSWRLNEQRGRWIALRKLDDRGATFSAVSMMGPIDGQVMESCFAGEEVLFPTIDPFGSGSKSKLSSSFDRAESVNDWLFVSVCELLNEPPPVAVRSIELWQSDLPDGWTEHEIGLLNRLGGVDAIALRTRSLSTEDLRTIFGMPGLQQLTLAVDRVADSDAGFAAADQLQRLCIADAALTNANFSGLSQLQRLERLDLRSTRFDSDASAIGRLERLSSLREVTLTSISTDDLHKLPQLKQVRRLSLDLPMDIPKTRKLAFLDRFPELESLSITNVGTLSDVDLDCLASVPKLRALSIKASTIDAEGMQTIGRHVQPRYLSLCDTGIDTSSAAAIGRMRSLEHLILADNPIDDGGLRSLDGLVALRILDIDRRQISMTTWVEFFRKHPQCRETP